MSSFVLVGKPVCWPIVYFCKSKIGDLAGLTAREPLKTGGSSFNYKSMIVKCLFMQKEKRVIDGNGIELFR